VELTEALKQLLSDLVKAISLDKERDEAKDLINNFKPTNNAKYKVFISEVHDILYNSQNTHKQHLIKLLTNYKNNLKNPNNYDVNNTTDENLIKLAEHNINIDKKFKYDSVYAIISHPDDDHCKGIIAIQKSIECFKKVYHYDTNNAIGSLTNHDTLDAVTNTKWFTKTVKLPSATDPDIIIDMTAQNFGTAKAYPNERSIISVVSIKYNTNDWMNMLITGDADEKRIKEAIERLEKKFDPNQTTHKHLKNIFKDPKPRSKYYFVHIEVPHHGSIGNYSQKNYIHDANPFYEKFKAKQYYISSASNKHGGTYGHPSKSVIEAIDTNAELNTKIILLYESTDNYKKDNDQKIIFSPVKNTIMQGEDVQFLNKDDKEINKTLITTFVANNLVSTLLPTCAQRKDLSLDLTKTKLMPPNSEFDNDHGNAAYCIDLSNGKNILATSEETDGEVQGETQV
jgi:beta-lactamase superfamily II metal-dependent hydrolase